MWGGKFGTKRSKIYGVWNPFIYPKDRMGRQIYLEEEYAEWNPEGGQGGTGSYYVYNNKNEWTHIEIKDEETLLANHFTKIICICDGSTKWIRKIPNENGRYKYLRRDRDSSTVDQIYGIDSLCPKGLPIRDGEDANTNKYYSASYVNEDKPRLSEQLKGEKWEHGKRPEKAEIIIDNFGDFDYKGYRLTAHEPEEGSSYATYDEVPVCGAAGKDCSTGTAAFGYIWEDSDIKMTSLEGEQDTYYMENADIRYRIPYDSSNKEVMISKKGIFRKSDVKEKEILDYTSEDLKYDPFSGLVKKDIAYSSKIDFFSDVKWTVVTESGEEIQKVTRVKAGTFYIMTDWNNVENSPYEMIHPIDDGMEKTKKLDRMEKCVAKQTFAIDADRNLVMYNYSMSPKYEDVDLQVFINPRTMKPYEPNSDHYNKLNGDLIQGNLRIIKQNEVYYKWTRTIAKPYTALGHTIIVDAEHFPGSFRVVGETFSRGRADHVDQRYQFEIPLCKLAADTSLQLQADGDPTTFSMELKVLRRDDGQMVRLTQYDVSYDKFDGVQSASTTIVPIDGPGDDPMPEDYKTYWTKEAVVESEDPSLRIMNPVQNTTYYLEEDIEPPFTRGEPFVESVEPTPITLADLDRSEVIVQEETVNKVYEVLTEYSDFDRTVPTGNVQKTLVKEYTDKKILEPDEYEFSIEDAVPTEDTEGGEEE